MKLKLKKIISYIFSKKTPAYRKGYIHFHRGKYPKYTDNPFKEGEKKYIQWFSGFSQAINDGISLSKKNQRKQKSEKIKNNFCKLKTSSYICNTIINKQ
jgi:hypothetical protein